MLGARLTLAGDVPGDAFTRYQIELGVKTGVVLGLAIGFLLVRVGDRSGGDGADQEWSRRQGFG